MSTVLSLSGVSKSFGGLKVIDDVSFAVPKGSRTALIGPNGAGKSTVFNLISGVYPIDSGRISALGQDITHMSVAHRVAHGLARSFQNIRLMPHLSTVEDVMLGTSCTAAVGPLALVTAALVFRSTLGMPRSSVLMGFMVPVTTTGMPFVMPPSSPPALLVVRVKPRCG